MVYNLFLSRTVNVATAAFLFFIIVAALSALSCGGAYESSGGAGQHCFTSPNVADQGLPMIVAPGSRG